VPVVFEAPNSRSAETLSQADVDATGQEQLADQRRVGPDRRELGDTSVATAATPFDIKCLFDRAIRGETDTCLGGFIEARPGGPPSRPPRTPGGPAGGPMHGGMGDTVHELASLGGGGGHHYRRGKLLMTPSGCPHGASFSAWPRTACASPRAPCWRSPLGPAIRSARGGRRTGPRGRDYSARRCAMNNQPPGQSPSTADRPLSPSPVVAWAVF
jgi:hypothetical protein